MTSFLKLDDDRVINLDQIVSAKFSPFMEGEDEESGKPFSIEARLVITLTSVSMDRIDGYDGEFLGAVATSDEEIVRGDWALHLWKVLSDTSEEESA